MTRLRKIFFIERHPQGTAMKHLRTVPQKTLQEAGMRSLIRAVHHESGGVGGPVPRGSWCRKPSLSAPPKPDQIYCQVYANEKIFWVISEN